MPIYSVRLPITGVMDLEVEAENEEQAIQNAIESNYSMNDISEWEPCNRIVKGNVFYGHTNQAEATLQQE